MEIRDASAGSPDSNLGGSVEPYKAPEHGDSRVRSIPISRIVPNQRQPRRTFVPQALKELSDSIAKHGILQPLIVRRLDDSRYELIAGERRLRAAQLAGLTSVPVLLRSVGSRASLEVALIENVQREDLDSLECALSYRRLIEEFGLTQEQVADRVGKSRSAVANLVRLLRLPPSIQAGLAAGKITEGHARALLGFADPVEQLQVYQRIIKRGLSVRHTERLLKRAGHRVTRAADCTLEGTSELASLEEALAEKLGARVQIGDSRIQIEYHSEPDLERILEALGIVL